LRQLTNSLIEANQDIEHPREWRPYILVLSNNQPYRNPLLDFAGLIEGGSGITSVVKILRSSSLNIVWQKEKALRELKKEIIENSHHAFPIVVSTLNSEVGLSTLFQSYGIGPVRANTVLLNWEEKDKDENEDKNYFSYQKYIQVAVQSGCSIVLLKSNGFNLVSENSQDQTPKNIDVWWQNDDTSRFMLLLSYLITRHKGWDSSQIRLLATHYDQDNQQNQNQLQELLEDFRIDASPLIIPKPDSHTIIEYSKEADLVFLPIKLNKNIPQLFSNEPVESILTRLKTCVLCLSAQRMELDAEPEDGKVKELVQIYDQFQLAEKKAALAEKYAVKIAEEAKEKIKTLKVSDDTNIQAIQKEIQETLVIKKKAISAKKRAFREKEKLKKVEDEAKSQGISTEE